MGTMIARAWLGSAAAAAITLACVAQSPPSTQGGQTSGSKAREPTGSPGVETARKRPKVEIVRAEIGFGGEGLAGPTGHEDRSGARALPDRYAPLRVWLSSEKGFSGAMVLEYAQDSTQSARVVVPAAATPGVVTPVDAVVCLPRSMPEIKLTLVDANQGPVLEAHLAGFPQGDEIKLWGTLDADHVYLLSAGKHSLAMSMPTTARLAAPRQPGEIVADEADWFSKLAAAMVSDIGDLPRSVGAYDGVEALVIAPETLGPADPRIVEAVRRWTLAGGKLVLVVGAGGSAWRQWLPENETFDFVDLGETTRAIAPPELRTIIGQMRDLAQRRDPDVLIPEAAGEVTSRAISLRPRGVREGWRTRWSVGDGRGLLAEGPVGFGFVTILGVDPERLGTIVDPRITRRVWRDALRGPLETWRRGQVQRTNENWWMVDDSFGASGADLPTRIGLSTVLDDLGKSHTVNPISFLVIAGSMGVLAVLLGLVDFFWLGAIRKRHLSWATALGWIGVASTLAVLVPTVVRGGDSAVSRWQVVDARSPRDGTGMAQATDVVASFVQRRSDVQLQGLPSTGWYRGVAASNSNSGRRHSRGLLLPPLELRESPGDPTAGCAPSEMVQPQWTFRALMGTAPISEPRISLDFEGDLPRLSVEIEEGASVSAGRLEMGAERYDLLFTREGRTWRATVKTCTTLGPFERQALELLRTNGGMTSGRAESESLGLSMRSEVSQEARLASGRWARVHLWIKDMPTGLTTGIEEKGTMTRIVRALVELPESRRREAAEPPWTRDVPPIEKGEKELREEAAAREKAQKQRVREIEAEVEEDR
jgi:hypothetical protein